MSKRIFIAFASEDAYARDFLVGQAKKHDSPFEWTDTSVKDRYTDLSNIEALVPVAFGLIYLLILVGALFKVIIK